MSEFLVDPSINSNNIINNDVSVQSSNSMNNSHDNLLFLTFGVMLINFLMSYFFYYSEKTYSKDDVLSANLKNSNDLKYDIIKFLSFANFSIYFF